MHVPAAGLMGPFRYCYATRSWWWSDEIFRLYGFEPGEVVPSLDLALFHHHPEDVDEVRALFTRLMREGGSWAQWHRIIATDGALRHVVSVGGSTADEHGAPLELRGWAVDVSSPHRGLTADRLDEAVRRSAETRSTIEQAKGVLIAVLGVDEDEAFEVLRRASQRDNVKVRDLAGTVMGRVLAARGDGLADEVTRLLVGGAGLPTGRGTEDAAASS